MTTPSFDRAIIDEMNWNRSFAAKMEAMRFQITNLYIASPTTLAVIHPALLGATQNHCGPQQKTLLTKSDQLIVRMEPFVPKLVQS